MDIAQIESVIASLEACTLDASRDQPSAAHSGLRRLYHALLVVPLDVELMRSLLRLSDDLSMLLSDSAMSSSRPVQRQCLRLTLHAISLCRIQPAQFSVNTEHLLRRLVHLCYDTQPAPDASLPPMAWSTLADLLQCVNGVLQWRRVLPADLLGELLGVACHFMFCGRPHGGAGSAPTLRPLFPQPHTLHEPCGGAPDDKPRPSNADVALDVRHASGKKIHRRRIRPPHRRNNRRRPPAAADDTTSSGAGVGAPAVARTAAAGDSSDSDVSDHNHHAAPERESSLARGDGSGRQRTSLVEQQTRVRQTALSLLFSVVVYADQRSLLGFWPALTPDTWPSSGHGGRTLAAVLLRDPSSSCRRLTATVLEQLMTASRPLLRGVEEPTTDRPPPAAFTPFSATMAALLRHLHRYLLLAVLAERSVAALVAVLRAVAALVANTPYERLRAGLLTRVSRHVRALLLVREASVRAAALDVLTSMVATGQPLREVHQLLQTCSRVDDALPPPPRLSSATVASSSGWSSAGTAAEEGDQFEYSDSDCDADRQSASLANGTDTQHGGNGRVRPWLWVRCRAFVLRRTDDTSGSSHYYGDNLRVQALRCLAMLCRNYLPVLESCVSELVDLLCRCADDHDRSVTLYAVRLLECVGGSSDCCGSTAATMNDVELDERQRLVAAVWQPLLVAGVVARLCDCQLQQADVTAGVCHALSTLGGAAFERLPRHLQLLSVTLLLPLTAVTHCAEVAGSQLQQGDGAEQANVESADTVVVRSAAVRALGVLVGWPALRDDAGFLLDVAEAAVAAAEFSAVRPHSPLRLNVLWTLANLADVLPAAPQLPHAQCDSGSGEHVQRPLSHAAVASLLEVAVVAVGEMDRVRVNAVRAIGSVLRHVDDDDVKFERVQALLVPAVEAVVRCMNASERGGGVARAKVRWNACYAAGNVLKNPRLAELVARSQLVATLCRLCCQCGVYKVRTNAAAALACACQRQQFGDNLPRVWLSVLEALEAAQNLSAAGEWRQRECLQRQLCLTLCRLAVWLQPEDVAAAAEAVRAHWSTVSEQLTRLPLVLPPGECGPPVLTARTKLQHLPDSCERTLLLKLFDIHVARESDAADPLPY